MWWDETIARWHGEGLSRDLAFSQVFEIAQAFGLDPYQQFWFSTTTASIAAEQHHTEGCVSTMDDYLRLKPNLFPDHRTSMEAMKPWRQRQADGAAVVWATLEGFFWFPRTLMDVEKLSYAYYDQPELVHAMNRDLLEFNLHLIRQMDEVCVPTFMTLAEDMSYNLGPMISEAIFDEFMLPYYKELVAALNARNIPLIVDTDGDVTKLVPWLQKAGVRGVLPLERQAGVDGMALRKAFPDFVLVGHYNKMIMDKGEAAMRAEFERLVPLMRSGRFIPSVDHQTPPGVSLENYHIYLRLLAEYTQNSA